MNQLSKVACWLHDLPPFSFVTRINNKYLHVWSGFLVRVIRTSQLYHRKITTNKRTSFLLKTRPKFLQNTFNKNIKHKNSPFRACLVYLIMVNFWYLTILFFVISCFKTKMFSLFVVIFKIHFGEITGKILRFFFYCCNCLLYFAIDRCLPDFTGKRCEFQTIIRKFYAISHPVICHCHGLVWMWTPCIMLS